MRRLPSAVAPLTLLLAAGLAGPAYAGHAVVHDPSHDVTVLDHAHEHLPRDRASDITRFRTRLTHRRVTLTLGLRRVPRDRYREILLVGTGRHVYEVSALRFGRTRALYLERDTKDGNLVGAPCAHLRQHRGRHAVVVTVPDSCLGHPAWVRTEAVTIGVDHGHDAADQAGRRGHVDLQRPELGRRVHA